MTKILQIHERLEATWAAIVMHKKATSRDPTSYALQLSAKSLDKQCRKLETELLAAADESGEVLPILVRDTVKILRDLKPDKAEMKTDAHD